MHIKPAIVVAFSLTAGLVLFWAVRRPPSDILKKTVLVEPATLEAKSEGGDASPLSFVIRNLGKTSIEIADVTATCGCTVVKVPRRNLASNGSMKIEVHATIPSVGERKSIIGIHTIPPQQVPLKVIVTLKGKEQPAPFISYCPDAITMSGSVLGRR